MTDRPDEGETVQALALEVNRLATKLAAQDRAIAGLEARAGSELARFSLHRARHWAMQRATEAALAAARLATEANERTLSGALAVARAQLGSVLASTSWRMTAPLRAVRGGGNGLVDALSGPPPALLPVPWPAAADIDHAEPPPATVFGDAELIRTSALFNEATYAGRADAEALGLDPVSHYISVGEAQGLAPSSAFDPAYYRARYPDVGAGLLAHFLRSGRAEGRRGIPVTAELEFPVAGAGAGRRSVLVVFPSARGTEAAILGYHLVLALGKIGHVVVLLQEGGPLEPALRQAAAVIRLPDGFAAVDVDADLLAADLVRHYAPLYAVANGSDTRDLVPALERAGIPTVSLIHEFPSEAGPPGILHRLFATASCVVFSDPLAAEAARADDAGLFARSFEVLLPGDCMPPPLAAPEPLPHVRVDDDALLVVGIGAVALEKGVEFFIQAAALVQHQAPTRSVRFAWVGAAGTDPAYAAYCRQQVIRSGLATSFVFLGDVPALDPVYEQADLYVLSSRLDALPVAAIGAALRGIPVLCFEQASGLAGLLLSDPTTRELVVPYLDAAAAGHRIAELADDPARLRRLSGAVQDLAAQTFNMARYAERIDVLGQEAASWASQQHRDATVITEAMLFDPSFYQGPSSVPPRARDALLHYLHTSRLVIPRANPDAGQVLRRPVPGFNPCTYAAENTAFDETTREDPLAHYVRTGQPKGPWAHAVIRPGAAPPAPDLRIALHGHFHYPDLLPDFLRRLQGNKTAPDLLLTTTSPARAETIAAIAAALGVVPVSIGIVPNRGRDLGALFTGIGARLLGYDLVGHVHGKKSPHAGDDVGQQWRSFLWENLLGGESPMMDCIAAAFAASPELGLVFPEDPHLNAWDSNRSAAEDLAARMGYRQPLPVHFDFPLGSSFWARPQALAPLCNLALDWDDYPEEPVAIDGTMLHALERLIPFAATHAGFEYRTTSVAGCTW